MMRLKITLITILGLLMVVLFSACGGGSVTTVTKDQNGGSVEIKTGSL